MKKFQKLLAAFVLAAMLLTAASCAPTGNGADSSEDSSALSSSAPGDSSSGDSSSGDSTGADHTVPDPVDLSGMDLSQYISLDYKGLTVEVDSIPKPITDADIDNELKDLLVYYEKYTLDTSRLTAAGDYIEMSYCGYVDGETSDSMTSEKATILLDDENSGYIAGFAAGLIGAKPGDTVDLNLTFPKDYYEDIAGKPVLFKVTVKGICKTELTDTIASELSEGKYKTVAEYRAHLKEYLETTADYELFQAAYQEIWTLLAEKAEVKGFPEGLYNYYYQNYVAQILQISETYQISYDEVMKMYGYTNETFEEYAKSDATNELILYYIAAAEGITMTDDEYRKLLDDMVKEYKDQGYSITVQEIEDYFGADNLRKNALSEKVATVVYENSTIVEKSSTEN